MSWLSRLIFRRRQEQQLDAELTFHVEAQIRDLVAAGVSADEARRRALATFGGVEPIKELARDARGTRWLDDLGRDIRYALRTMRRTPGFTVAAVLSLAIGIGANTAIFSVVNGLLIRPLPIREPSQIHLFRIAGYGAPTDRFSHPAFLRYQATLSGVSLAAMSSDVRLQVIAGDQTAELVLGQLVSGEWFGVLGIEPAAGRLFTPNDDRVLDGHPQVVLSHAYWMSHFGGAPSTVGSTIKVNGVPMTVIGVAAKGFTGLTVGESVDLWAPVTMQSSLRYQSNASIDDADPSKPWLPQDGVRWLSFIARVAPPATVGMMTAQAQTVFRQQIAKLAAAETNPADREYDLRGRLEVIPGARGQSDVRDTFGRAVLVLMATVALVLLVACANLANLLMARSAVRQREFALRLSLGAGRGRLIRQLLTEALVLAFIGGAASLMLAQVGASALLRLASDGPAPIALDVGIDWTVGAFAGGLAVVTGLFFGLLPALRLSRANPHDAMKAGGRVLGAERTAGTPVTRLLVVAQVALSLLLLVGAVLFVRTLHNLLNMNTGFDRQQVISARLDPRSAGYTAKTMPALRRRLVDAAAALPGVRSTAVAMCGNVANCHRVSDIEVPGRPRGTGSDNDVQEDYVDAPYFDTVGMRLASGRAFADFDTETSPPVAVINETMARHFFPNDNPVGRKFEYDKDTQFEVVGVVRDAKVNGLREDTPRMVYYPIAQHPDDFPRNVYVRVAGDAAPVERRLREAIASVDRDLAVREVVTLADLTDRTVARERLVSDLTGAFGLLAVAVACLGLYGTVSYTVARRTNEIGIRMALGASVGNVRWLVLRETLWLVLAGIVVGLGVTLPLVRYIATLLYGLSSRDPMTLAASAGLLLAVGLVAGAIPAWRASRISPTSALRND